MKFKILLVTVAAFTLFLAVRGLPGNPSPAQLDTPEWKGNGPFELSPERGRFALLYSLVENHSFYFSLPLASFATPDLGYKNGHYVSLFAPAVSYIVIPGYLIGHMLGSSQFGAFAVIAVFALFNFMLIRAIAIRLKINPWAASLGALVFLFATPAFSYAATLYQHHITTFLILVSLYLLMKWNNWWSTALVWFFCALSIPIDYPNLILMFPIGFFALGRVIMVKLAGNDRLNIKISSIRMLTLSGIIFPLVFFCWFNYRSYGNPFQFSGTVPDVNVIDSSGKPAVSEYELQKSNIDPQIYLNPDLQKKSVISFFNSRNLINGFYIHLISPDRGILYFTPVIILSAAGFIVLFKKREPLLPVLLGIIGADIVMYSMWGDPWGGWAFGSRYLIPGYAVLCIFLAAALDKFRKHNLFLIVFMLLFFFSVAVNTLGAITSSSNPPEIETETLSRISDKKELFSFDRNYEYLMNKGSKSFVYITLAHRYFTPIQYYLMVAALPGLMGLFMLIYLRFYVRN